MLELSRTPRLKRDVKACQRRHWDMSAFREAITLLARSDEEPVPEALHPHGLHGDLQGYRAVHVPSHGNPARDTWVIVYVIAGDGHLLLVRTGVHDEVYG